MIEIRHYKLSNGKSPFKKWFTELDYCDKRKISTRLDRIEETGNFGDYKNLGDGVFEMRFHFGAGY